MSGIPKSVPNKYRERIAHWDDEREIGNSLIVSLRGGWRFPAVECHTEGFDTVRDAIGGLRESKPCECAECLRALAVRRIIKEGIGMEQNFFQRLGDLVQAKKVRAMQRDPGRYRIGVMRQSFRGTMGGIKAGDVVLFDSSGYDDSKCTIEMPLPDKWIEENKTKGSLITTFRTCIGVSLSDVDEVPLNNKDKDKAMAKNTSWCLGSGREPGFMVWSDWKEKTGIEQADGSYICPDCGRAVLPTYRGNQPAKLARHKKPVN